jgi:hypothetical protein
VALPRGAGGSSGRFVIGREFAHIHPVPGCSLHAALSPEVAEEAVEKGWAEQRPAACQGYILEHVVMTYALRNEQEVEIVVGLVDDIAPQYAIGDG